MNANNDLCFCETGTGRSVEVLKVQIWTQGRVGIGPELSDRPVQKTLVFVFFAQLFISIDYCNKIT
jgi:hypothetical protein